MYLLALNLYIKLDAVHIGLDTVDIKLDALLHTTNASWYLYKQLHHLCQLNKDHHPEFV